ncbi:T9SS type A sorting domain-containing protein [Flammeovirga kamogawensis]|uniref:Secretion system C-terminal sorting domain-containing protein n=1 Tax=Flammeovirga kamogawensis TaxID=373891 RepID=A0ABX8H149_9BACT|nr:T9SS type A sorting domain-containing protein [Flammeovirga kamogawensis]MBB6463295.1 hypothetical protein [Flammeovirga kamogawensis]QWG09555.1 hypothetical protein KM029_23390 [Flammeovirga kamogawensis]TRX65069.1 hypothetical protein EO216_21285 [Flammeovirga kamogawensis]
MIDSRSKDLYLASFTDVAKILFFPLTVLKGNIGILTLILLLSIKFDINAQIELNSITPDSFNFNYLYASNVPEIQKFKRYKNSNKNQDIIISKGKHFTTKSTYTAIYGNVTIFLGGKLTVEKGHTLVIYGNVTVKGEAHLFNYNNLVIKGNLQLGTTKKPQNVYFKNFKESNLYVKGDFIGPHPHKSVLNGHIAIDGNVDFHFHIHDHNGNDMSNSKSFYYKTNNKLKADGGDHDTIILKLKGSTNSFIKFGTIIIPDPNTKTKKGKKGKGKGKGKGKKGKKDKGNQQKFTSKEMKITTEELLKLKPYLSNIFFADLPVELTSFNVTIENGKVFSVWETAQEINNSHFKVERSVDGKNYETIAEFVEGAGNSNVSNTYEVEDEKPQQGKVYYRLTQVDFDGKTESWIEVLNNGEREQGEVVSIYPNPAQYTLNVALNLMDDEEATFEFINTSTGHLVNNTPNLDLSRSKAVFDVSTFTPGTYVLIVKLNGKISHRDQVVILGNKSRGNEKEKEDKK